MSHDPASDRNSASDATANPEESAPIEFRAVDNKALLAHIRHELRTPINALIGYSEMLLEDAQDSGHESFLDQLGQVHALGKSLLALTNDLLDSNRLDPDKPLHLEVLAAGVRRRLSEPIKAVIECCQALIAQTVQAALAPFAADLQRIHSAGHALATLSNEVFDCVRPNQLAPAKPPAGAEVATQPASAEEPGSGLPHAAAGHVLVVDDNAFNRDILGRWLYRQGHAFALAHNGRQALEMLANQPMPFDLVLLDILMPEMDGFEVLKHMKAEPAYQHLPVIMISALDEVDSVVRCIAMGADDYLSKPFNPVLLEARVNASLEKKRLRDRELIYLEEIKRERERADTLLNVILPGAVVDELKMTNAVKPRRFDQVAVLFADIVGFTPYCDCHAPEEVVKYLQSLVETWEDIAIAHHVQKIKTIGDAFMAASGLLEPVDNPVLNCVRCGYEMIRVAQQLDTAWNVRVGIHVGQVMAGVLGKRQYLYDLFGDTVNTAARMESHGVPGSITLSAEAWELIAHCSRGESLGIVTVKGKGSLAMMRFIEFTQCATSS